MTSNPPTLQVDGLQVHYGPHHALKDLSLTANAKDLIAVIGPNGAGKTTFIKALAGQVQHQGIVSISGKTFHRRSDRRAHIGLVPQDIGLYPHMTAQENLQVMARMMGVARADIRDSVNWALDAVGLADKAGKRLSALSGGMKRRINVAAAIMHKPDVLIFDEPTAGVDVPARDVVHKLARQMAERNMVVLLITHELEQAEALSDRLLLLKDGHALAFQTPEDLLNAHFGAEREVVVRFTHKPDTEVRRAMYQFAFAETHHDTVFKTRTTSDENRFAGAFAAAMRNFDHTVREISIRRPGLETLLHDLEQGLPLGQEKQAS